MSDILALVITVLFILIVGVSLAFRLYFQACRHFAEIERGMYTAIELYAKEAMEASEKITQLQMIEQHQHQPFVIHFQSGEVGEYYSVLPPQYITKAQLN